MTPPFLPLALPRERTWTPTFVVFLAYVFIIVTYKLGLGTAAMVLALCALVFERQRLRAPRFLGFLAAWIAWAALGYVATPYPDEVWAALIQHGKLFLVALVAVNALRTGTQIRYFIVFVLASYLLFPIRATLLNYVGGYTNLGRAVGPFIYENANDLAAITILMLAPALALFTGGGGPRRPLVPWFGLGCAVAFVVTILLTQSRGAFLALAVIGLPSGVAVARRHPRLTPLFAALVAVALYLAPAGLWERVGGLSKGTSVETIGDMDPEGSARVRFAVLQTAVRIVADRPVLGVGLGSYAHANRDYSPAVGAYDTHNTYLNIAAETGLPGLALFLAMMTSLLRGALAARRRADRHASHLGGGDLPHWLQLGLIAFLIAALFGSFAKLAFVYVYLSLLWSASRAVVPDPAARRHDMGVAAM
jgi:O-antigen ligase